MRVVVRPAGPLPALFLLVTASAPAAEVVRYVPSGASSAGLGGTYWTTSVTLFNPSADRPLTVRVAFLPEGRDGRSAPEVSVEVPSRRAVTLSDLVGGLLGASGRGGIRLRADGDFLATSRTGTPGSSGGTYGVAVPVFPAESALASSLLLAGSPQGPSDFRTNAGALNPSTTGARATFVARDAATGAVVSERAVDLPPLGHGQLDDLFAGHHLPNGGLVEVTATASADVCGCPAADCCRLPSPVLAWATEIDQRTGDASWVSAQADPRAEGAAGPAGRYLMPLHTCDAATTACQDPRNHTVGLAESDDGRGWRLVAGFTPYPGSVPDAVRRGATLYLYTPGRLVRWHLDTGVQEVPVPVTVSGLPDGYVDPSPVVDEEGRIALFFLRGTPGSDPAGCPAGTACVKRFGSATEVEGSDGAAFTLDTGDRVSLTAGAGQAYLGASDPDVFPDGTRWVCYVSHGPSMSVWTSASLRGSYTRLGDLTKGTGGVGAGHFDAGTGKYWTFAHVFDKGVATVRRAVHDRLDRTLGEAEMEAVVTAASLGLPPTVQVQSPGFLVNAP